MSHAPADGGASPRTEPSRKRESVTPSTIDTTIPAERSSEGAAPSEGGGSAAAGAAAGAATAAAPRRAPGAPPRRIARPRCRTVLPLPSQRLRRRAVAASAYAAAPAQDKPAAAPERKQRSRERGESRGRRDDRARRDDRGGKGRGERDRGRGSDRGGQGVDESYTERKHVEQPAGPAPEVDIPAFAALGLEGDLLAGVAAMGYDDAHPDPGAGHPARARRSRRRGLRPDRHRQDGRLRAAHPAAHERAR